MDPTNGTSTKNLEQASVSVGSLVSATSPAQPMVMAHVNVLVGPPNRDGRTTTKVSAKRGEVGRDDVLGYYIRDIKVRK